MQILNPFLPVFTFPIPINLQNWKDVTKGIYTDMLRDSPTRVQISESKMFNTQRTMSTWVTSHWGENLPQMQCSGNIIILPGQEALSMLSLFVLRSLYKLDKNPLKNMGSKILKYLSVGVLGGTALNDILGGELNNLNLNINKGIQSIATTYSLAAYTKRLAQLDITGLSPTFIMHDNFIYQGYFTNFTYTKDIQNPRKIQYQFTLNIEWNSADAIVDMFKNTNDLKTIVNIMQ